MVVDELQSNKQNQPYSNATEKIQASLRLYNSTYNNHQTPEISVIIPAFNEEKVVGSLIDRTEKVIQKITKNYEIIVIDDGSKDQTLQICKEKRVILIHNLYNCGKGHALREGFKIARGEIIITMDSDGEHRPEEIPLIIKPILDRKVDIVLGSRFSEIPKREIPITSAVNSFGNRFFNFLIRRLTNHKFTDTQCGFRAFSRVSLSKLKLQSLGYNIETEMIVKIAKQNLTFCEVPINSPVSIIRKTNLSWIRDGFRILYTIFKNRLKNP